ncbi:anti-sigma factor [Marinobacter halodurans]|uniref:Anti-sigma factor n=1 Tax=Marinobacter halodurans TaxID=2528979 RepID=A0ABY1ZND0_9GAMM|nr:sigma-E factor negative regulatory protein [Marinobacter halodurans]TBW57856.1 anti-sigma factor [Marinobacter halodurans]
MDDRLRETLSAMMDDQADELAVRRLLSRAGEPEVREQWQRWQQLRNLMHDERRDLATVDVSNAVRAAIDADGDLPEREEAGTAASNSARRSLRWSAVAAVSMALLVGFGAGAHWSISDEGRADTLTAGLFADGAGNDEAGSAPKVPEIALQGLDDEQREQMSRYLLEHAQHNSVGMGYGSMGYARVASVSTGLR